MQWQVLNTPVFFLKFVVALEIKSPIGSTTRLAFRRSDVLPDFTFKRPARRALATSIMF